MVLVSNKFGEYSTSVSFLGKVVVVMPGSTTHTKNTTQHSNTLESHNEGIWLTFLCWVFPNLFDYQIHKLIFGVTNIL